MKKQSDIKKELLADIYFEEQRFEEIRGEKEQSVFGATELKRQSMTKSYTPLKRSRRMICICSDLEIRKGFISFFKAICDEARKVFSRWKQGDIDIPIPPGLLAPRVPSLCSVLNI